MENKEPFIIRLLEIDEHEDGSATYSFAFDGEAAGAMAKLGLEFVVRCAAYSIDIQDALDYLKTYGERHEGNP